MFLFLSKLLPLFIYPLGLACVALAGAYLMRRSRRWLQILLALGLLLLLGASNSYVSGWLLRSLEWRHLPSQDYPQADAIVLLGGGTSSAIYPRRHAEFNDAGDRVLHAAWLHKAGKAPIILASGGSLPWTTQGVSPAEDMASLLVFMGVPEEAVLLESRSANTYENALFSRPILEELNAERILLVTSAMHMPRSVLIFEKMGFEVIPAPADFNVVADNIDQPFSKTWPNYLFGFLPEASDLSLTTRVLKEYFGIVVYRLRGWL